MKAKNTLSFGLIAAAAVILANPMPLLIDFLPDAIAYLLLIVAVGRLCSAVPEIVDIKDSLTRLLIVSVAKIPAFFIMCMIWSGDSAQRSIIAVFTFAFAVIELCFLIPAIHCFFDAFYHMGRRFDSESPLAEGTGMLRMRPERIEGLTIAFFIVRSVMSTLPEMALVPVNTVDLNHGFNWNSLYIWFAVFGALITVAVAVVWCCYFFSYLRRMTADKDLMAKLSDASGKNPALENRNLFRLLRVGTVLFCIGVFCTFDFYFDHINYLPDLLAALAFFGAAYCFWFVFPKQSMPVGNAPAQPLLHRGRRYAQATWILSLVYGGATVLHTVFSYLFITQYSYESVELIVAAEKAYSRVLITSALAETLLVAVVLLFLCLMLHFVRLYTGVAPVGSPYTSTERKTKTELKRKFLFCTATAVLYAVSSLIYEWSLSSTTRVAANSDYTRGYVVVPTLEWMWAVVWGLGLVWLITSLHTFSRLREEAELNLVDELG